MKETESKDKLEERVEKNSSGTKQTPQVVLIDDNIDLKKKVEMPNNGNHDANGINGNEKHPLKYGTCVTIKIDLNSPSFKSAPKIGISDFQNAFKGYVMDEQGIMLAEMKYAERKDCVPDSDVEKKTKYAVRIRSVKPDPIIGTSLDTDKRWIFLSYLKGDEAGKEIITGFYKHLCNSLLEVKKQEQEKPLEILLVDDDESVLRVNKSILEMSLNGRKYTIDTAMNGAEAIEKAKLNRGYELIITDYRMPVMNGLEFYKRLRDVNPEQQKKVFMFTADNVSEVRNMVDNALSPEDYQHLPIFSKFDVIEKIREIIKPFLS